MSKNIKEQYAGQDVSPEARMARKLGDDFGTLADMFARGVAQAAMNYRAANMENVEGINDDYVKSVGVEISKSERITNKSTLDFLNEQEKRGDVIVTYKTMQIIDGKLYSPMAAKVKGADGKYHLSNPNTLGVWQQAVEDPSNIKIKNGRGYYTLNKGNGKSVDAAYNPYEHSSNLVLNDQFEEAYKRPNLVTVECIIPKSEMTSRYRAQYAKDSTGFIDWKAGTVAGQLSENQRKVYLSRYLKPVRIISDSEVALMYKSILQKDNISVPFNVVTPSLLAELEKSGVPIDYEGSPIYKAHNGDNTANSDTNKYSNLNPTENDDIRHEKRLDTYTETQYNNFGWARANGKLSYNELEDMYSKIMSKKSLNAFPKTNRGEAIIELDDKAKTTLGAPTTFVTVTGTKSNPKITRVIRTNGLDENDLNVIRRYLRDGYTYDRYFELYYGTEAATEYSRFDCPDYHEYIAQRRMDNGEETRSGESDGNPNNRDNQGLEDGGRDYRESEEVGARSNEIKQERLPSERDLLVAALEEVTDKKSFDYEILTRYKTQIEEAEKQRQIISDMQEKLFTPSKRGDMTVKEIREEMTKAANRLDTIDKKLLRITSAKPFKRLLERERAKARRTAKSEMRENYDKRTARQKIRSELKSLRKMIREQSKEKNVKNIINKSHTVTAQYLNCV